MSSRTMSIFSNTCESCAVCTVKCIKTFKGNTITQQFSFSNSNQSRFSNFSADLPIGNNPDIVECWRKGYGTLWKLVALFVNLGFKTL